MVIAIWAIHMIQGGLLLLQLEGWVIDIFEPESTGQVYFALLTLLAGWEGGADGRILSYTTPQIVYPAQETPMMKKRRWLQTNKVRGQTFASELTKFFQLMLKAFDNFVQYVTNSL